MTRDFLKPQKTTGLDTNAPAGQRSRFAPDPFPTRLQPKPQQPDLQTLIQRGLRLGDPMAKAWANVQPTVDSENQASVQAKHEQPDLQTLIQRGQRLGDPMAKAWANVQPTVDSENQASVQTQLTVGQRGDKYEKEADEMASQVMSMPESDTGVSVQSQESTEPAQETKQNSSLTHSITPLLQTQTGGNTQPSGEQSTQANSSLETQLTHTGSGSPLSDEVQSFMGSRFGADFSQVRVHTGSNAIQMNQELGAQAFTHGNNIYFGQGKYPGKNDLTAHELTHTIQQTSGLGLRVQGLFWDSDENEKESDSDSSGGLFDWVSDAASSVADTASNTWDTATDFASDTWDATKDTTSDVWSGVTDTASSVADTASNTWDTATDFASDTWDATKDTASDVWSGVSDTASDTWDQATDFASDTWDSTKDTASESWDWTKEKAEEYKLAERSLGALQTIGGAAEIAIGTAGILAPEPASTIAGGLAYMHGIDTASAGLTQLLTGETQETWTQKGVTAGAEAMGVSPEKAQLIGTAADIGLGFINPAGLATGTTKIAGQGSKLIDEVSDVSDVSKLVSGASDDVVEAASASSQRLDFTDTEIDDLLKGFDDGTAATGTYLEMPGQKPITREGLQGIIPKEGNRRVVPSLDHGSDLRGMDIFTSNSDKMYHVNHYLTDVGNVKIADSSNVPLASSRLPGKSIIPDGVGIDASAPPKTKIDSKPLSGNVEVRYHSPSPTAPSGTRSAEQATIQVNTPSKDHGWLDNQNATIRKDTPQQGIARESEYLLPDGRWIRLNKNVHPEEDIAAAHWPIK